ncbi:MAG: response regulator [Chloroflexi bacterium]|nr:response regulator [Chloroflexota bacterium]
MHHPPRSRICAFGPAARPRHPPTLLAVPFVRITQGRALVPRPPGGPDLAVRFCLAFQATNKVPTQPSLGRYGVLRPRRILVVDDTPDIQDVIVLALAGEGYEVVTADHGAAALEIMRQWKPDVILLDLQMPVMDGWTFVRTYRQTPGRHAPIVVMTAAYDAWDRAKQIGADDVLPKPFDLDDLFERVERFTRARARAA